MDEGGQLHTLTVLEQLREASKALWGASSTAYFRVDELLRQLANPNLHDIPRNLPFRVEMWDCNDQHIRWVIAASASVVVGHAALDAAIANYIGIHCFRRAEFRCLGTESAGATASCAAGDTSTGERCVCDTAKRAG